MNSLEVLDWNYKLQSELDQLSQDDLEKYLLGKAIRFNGQLYTLTGKLNEATKRKNNKGNRKTSRASKRINGSTKNSKKNYN